MGKQIFGYTDPNSARPGEVVRFVAVLLDERTGEVTLRTRELNGRIVEIPLPPTAAAELGCSLSTAVFPFLPTNRGTKYEEG